MTSIPARANVPAIAASSVGGQSLRLQRRARERPGRAHRSACGYRQCRSADRRNARRTTSGNSASTSVTSSCSDVLPNSMLRSCPASKPVVSTASRMRTSKMSGATAAMFATCATTSCSTRAFAHRRQRRFDALLERDRLRARVDRVGRRVHAVGGGDPAVGVGRRMGRHGAILEDHGCRRFDV